MNEKYVSTAEVTKNKIKSAILVLIMMLMCYFLSYAIGYMAGNESYGKMIGIGIAVLVIPFQLITAKMSILAMTKGTPINTNDERQARLKRMTETLAENAGMKRVPDLYITPSDVPNAFASGTSEKNAFICVTQGLLNILDEREMSGVIGHEISHIVHRDRKGGQALPAKRELNDYSRSILIAEASTQSSTVRVKAIGLPSTGSPLSSTPAPPPVVSSRKLRV